MATTSWDGCVFIIAAAARAAAGAAAHESRARESEIERLLGGVCVACPRLAAGLDLCCFLFCFVLPQPHTDTAITGA